MKRTPLKRQSDSPTAKIKREIQKTLREIKLKEQGDCWVKLLFNRRGEVNMDSDARFVIAEMGDCDEVKQYDHLESRARNISYANPKLGVLVCRRHHFWHGSPRKEQRETYERLVRLFIGPERAKLWDKVKNDRKNYPMGIYEWNREIMALKQELKKLDK